MDVSTTFDWLSKAIGQATRTAKFCVAGSLPAIDPGIEVEGLGHVKIPLKGAKAKELIALCQVAPYGKGVQTLTNKKVRNTLELDPKKFHLSDAWNAAIADLMPHLAGQLGLPVDQLEARLYKLLIYEKGGFFLPHRDSEKHDRMVASLVVALPNRFEGGSLLVRHGAAKQTLNFEEAASGQAPSYAAFYADCEHEVQRVTGGLRLCLAYNLALKPQRTKPSATTNPSAPIDALATSIRSWVTTQPAEPLIFALEHHYTQRGLSLDLLKGADRQLADLVVAAAQQTDCVVHFVQVSRHLMQFADDGSFAGGYSRYGRSTRRTIEIGETYEDDLTGTEWTDISGKKQPWGQIAFDRSAIVSSIPIDDWKPTSEEFEGYTGNAGNTLDRWYHRSAIVIWHRDHHFDVVASSGAINCIPLLSSMVAKLSKTPKKRFEEARLECIRFAKAIIARWPRRIVRFGYSSFQDDSPCDDFPEQLLALHDRDTMAMFLTKLPEHDFKSRLSSFVVAACRDFGWNAFTPELKRLLTLSPNVYGCREIQFRDVEWLSEFSGDKTAESDKSAVAYELCRVAADIFCELRPPRPTDRWRDRRHETSESEKSLPLLLKALVASRCDDGLSRVIRSVEKSPDEFTLEDSQVPCLITLIPWSRKRLGSVPSQLLSWMASVRQKLESATAKQPEPPADWSRPAEISCGCRYCAQLKEFLTDPASEVTRIPAREDLRRHVIGSIDQHQCDVKHALERTGSPHALKLTKTSGSFERAVKRFEADRKLLGALPSLD